MGGSASSAQPGLERAPHREEDDALWSDHAWKCGAPFSLLTDDAFVTEKYQELMQGTPSAKPLEDVVALEMTGKDELPLSELEQMADRARINLFANAKASASKTGELPSKPMSVIEMIKDTSMARESHERIVSERRHYQQSEIVRDYLSKLAVRLAARAKESQDRERIRKELNESRDAHDRDSITFSSAAGDASSTGECFFKLAAFRMQLEMLHGFRTSSPRVFEKAAHSMIKTALDFPPFSLTKQREAGATSDSAVSAIMVDDMCHFCEELEQCQDLSSAHRDLLLLLQLAIGICSGQCNALLAFAVRALQRGDSPSELRASPGEQKVQAWLLNLVRRLESYRVQYTLGTLTEDSFVRQIDLKVMKDTEAKSASSENQQRRPAIATDGTYLFTWSKSEGLKKIGSGNNYSVAGRIYALSPPHEFFKHIREKIELHTVLYGSVQDVTSTLREATKGPASFVSIHQLAQVAGASLDRGSRLFVVTVTGGTSRSQVFASDEVFTIDAAQSDSVHIETAFYGDFECLGDESLQQLQESLGSGADDTVESGIIVDEHLIRELYPRSCKTPVTVSDEMQLIVVYSASERLGAASYAIGDRIPAFEDRSADIYHSSLVYCNGHLFLSMLHPGGCETIDQRNHRPRSLLVISPVDLVVQGKIQLAAGSDDESTGIATARRVEKPLFSYVTEGHRLYEIELCADRFRVRVFRVQDATFSGNASFQRFFDLHIKKVQCATYVGCLLKLLKAELRVGDYDFELPTFFTNGSFICVALPSITSALDAKENATARRRFDCLLFDCDKGDLVLGEKETRNEDGVEDTLSSNPFKSFERALPGGCSCFDATNNLIWVLSSTHSAIAAYRNRGRRIPVVDEEGDCGSPHELLQLREDGVVPVSKAATQVLSFVAKHTEEGCPLESLSSKSRNGDDTTRILCFDFASSTLQVLIDLSQDVCNRRSCGDTTPKDLFRLRCCLLILRRSVEDAVRSSHPDSKASLQLLATRLPALVASLIDPTSPELGQRKVLAGDTKNRQALELRVVSAALGLNASLMQVSDTTIEKQVQRAVELVRKWRLGQLSKSNQVVAITLVSQLRSTMESSGELALKMEVMDQFVSLWEELVQSQTSKLLATESRAQASELETELTGLTNFVIQGALARALGSEDCFRFALLMFRTLCNGLLTVASAAQRCFEQAGDRSGPDFVEECVANSILRQVTPTILLTGTLALREWNQKTTVSTEIQAELGSFLLTDVTCLQDLYRALSELSVSLGVESKTTAVDSFERTTRTEVMESAHEYANDLDVTTKLEIPGATRMTITFDSRSRTELSYDYVTFYSSDAHSEVHGERYYCGRDGEHNWPGVDGNPPLVIESDHCYVYFHTDASNTDWGYRFTAVGEILEQTTINQRHWLSSITEMALGILAEAGRLLVDGTQLIPITEREAHSDSILRSGLVRHGSVVLADQAESVVRLLRDFVRPVDGSDAARVLQAIETKTGESRLRRNASSAFVDNTNGGLSSNSIAVAIRATTAALLHHNMWGMDAFALVQNLRTDVSEQLLRGWRNAQKMRHWFHLGDAARAPFETASNPGLRSGANQPSAYKGMTDEAMHVLSNNIVERAMFLLEMTPMAFSYVSGAKKRWEFLDKYGTALSDADVAAKDEYPLDKWYHLLDELQDATELRSLLHYRKSSSERRKTHQTKTVTEQVLEFLQSDIVVDDLRRLIKLRSLRAEYRACGFRLFQEAMRSRCVPRLQLLLVETFSASLQSLARTTRQTLARLPNQSPEFVDALPPSRLHFGTLLSGCESRLRKKVNEAFGACLTLLMAELSTATDPSRESAGTDLIVAIIKAICLDYDTDDTYLLQESNALPTLLQLLGSGSSRIQRAAQNLLEAFLSRLVDAKAGSGDSTTVTAFQKRLFATVGLQLEGVASRIRELGGGAGSYDLWGMRAYNLARPSSSWTVPVSKQCDIRWNNTLMLWVYIPSSTSTYALKIGDEVRPGPSWRKDDTIDTNDTGVIVGIPTPTSVMVKWTTTNLEAQYQFDPKGCCFEVILAHDSVGGVVFCKGTKNLVKESGKASPWSHFGLYLSDQRQLSYKISCGAEKECTYDTNFELETNEWAHVAIVQNEDILKLYVNGLMVTQHILDPFLSLKWASSSMESRVVESSHPITEPVDQYWSVHIPGASKIRVVFDPLCDIDMASGYVRFYKDATCSEKWGEDKYSGRYHDPERNFPGALSNRHRGRRSLVAASASQGALEIPSDRFLVYFHHNGDSLSWGFRLLATPEFVSASSMSTTQRPRLNLEPVSVGEPQPRVADEPTAKCWITAPEVVMTPLSEEEIVDEMQSSCPSTVSSPEDVPVDHALHVLSLLCTCSTSPCGRDLVSTPENIRDLMTIVFDDNVPTEVRCGGIVMLKDLCQSLPPEFVNSQFAEALPSVGDGTSFVNAVFEGLRASFDCWSRRVETLDTEDTEISQHTDRFDADTGPPPCPMELQAPAAEANMLTSAFISLLRSLATIHEWREQICLLIEAALSKWRQIASHATTDSDKWQENAGDVMAALVLMGGELGATAIGRRVQCCANIDGKESIETGYMIRMVQHSGSVEETVLGKCFRMRRHARILFDCDPRRPIDVPVEDVTYMSDVYQKELEQFLQCVIPALCEVGLGDIFGDLIHDHSLSSHLARDRFKPKQAKKENVEVLESEHPYRPGEDVVFPLHFHGAREIVIYFDAKSSTISPEDYVSFHKREDGGRPSTHPESLNDKPYWGEERYHGTDFPGVGGRAALRIPASSVDVVFRTAPTRLSASVLSDDWGFKLSAHAYEETVSYPREIPPYFVTSAITEVRSRAIKVLQCCLQVARQSLLRSVRALLPSLVAIANQADDTRPTQCAPKKQIFESKHPYANSVKECLGVTFSGASWLVVTFDVRSRTEKQTDYVTFYKDNSLTDRWGELYYSGADVEANWPGVAGRPPLVISSDSFTLLWCTDASNVDWGWKFTVVAEYPSITPLSMRIDQLEKHAHDLWEVFYDGVGPQRMPYVEEFEGYEKITGAEDCTNTTDSIAKVLRVVSSVETSSIDLRPSLQKTFRVIDEAGVDVHIAPTEVSDVIQHLSIGDEVECGEVTNGWIQVSLPGGACESGWVRLRIDDKIHIVDTRQCARDEDLMVLGIDDTPEAFHKMNLLHHLDNSNPEHNKLSHFCSQYSYETLKGQAQRLQSFAHDVHRALAIRYARRAVGNLLTSDQSFVTFTDTIRLSDFGSCDALLQVVMHLVDDKDDNVDVAAIEAHLETLIAASTDTEDAVSLVDTCMSTLSKATLLVPNSLGAARTIESRHPYLDDVDLYWQVSIPGAYKIVIYFDPRSKIEAECDWVCFYKPGSGRAVKYADTNFSGRNGTENWPGCGGRPPLVIQNDRVEVHFHSDANQNDWGFKLFAVGMFKPCDIGLSENPLHPRDMELIVRLLRTCLWLLELAARACGRDHTALDTGLSSCVYSARMVRLALETLNRHPRQVRPLALKLIHALMGDRLLVHALPSSLVQDLRHALVVKLRTHSEAAESLEAKSQYLQELTECLLLVDLAIDSGANSSEMLTDSIGGSQVVLERKQGQIDVFEWSMVPVSASCRLCIDLLLETVSSALQIEVVLHHPSVESEATELLLHWDADGVIIASPMCGITRAREKCTLTSGDRITLEVDLAHRFLVVRKNDVSVYVGYGLETMAAEWIHEVTSSGSLGITITSGSPEDVIRIRTRAAPLSLVPVACGPMWYNKLCESTSFLLDFHERRDTSVIECESDHPLTLRHNPIERYPVVIKGAIALEIRFDRRTMLSDAQTLRFFSSDSSEHTALSGIKGTRCDELPGLFVSDPLKRGGSLRPGDAVVRSFDWCYGDEDGGPGCLGMVEDIVAWCGQNGAGVRVRWSTPSHATDSSTVGIYRYGFDNRFDVQAVRNSRARHTPLIIQGDTLLYSVDYKAPATLALPTTEDFPGTLLVGPTFGALSLDLRKSKMLLGDDCTIEWWICLHESSLLSGESRSESTLIRLMDIATLDPSYGLVVCVSSEGDPLVASCVEDQFMPLAHTPTALNGSRGRIQAGLWTHLALMLSASRLSLYVDGEQQLEVTLDRKVLSRNLFVSSIEIGSMPAPGLVHGVAGVEAIYGHVRDVRVWDVGLRNEQIRSHAHGIDSVSTTYSTPATPLAPRKPSRSMHLAHTLPPPSPPRSPTSRSLSVPTHQRKWVTSNRTGKDLVTVRATCSVLLSSGADPSTVVYYEAHILSGGKLSLGWADVNASPPSRDALLGEFAGGFGIELPRFCGHFNGEATVDLDNPRLLDGMRSPRRSSSSGSSSGWLGDVFTREGDVVGCSLAPATMEFAFFLNGELLAKTTVSGEIPARETSSERPTSPPTPSSADTAGFDSLVDELLTMGFSRQASEDAIEASSTRSVPQAINWLLEECASPGERASISSPRRLSTPSPFASPRRHRHSSTSATASCQSSTAGVELRGAAFAPAATLSAQGAQGIAWNFGQRPFKFRPPTYAESSVISVLRATGRAESDTDFVSFEVFDLRDRRWETVAHRHRIQDTVPSIIAHWKLDEGSGTTVYDSSGRDLVGTVRRPAPDTSASLAASSVASCWDAMCLPPVAVERRADSFFSGAALSSPIKESPNHTVDESVWGYRFYVIPHFSNDSIGRRRFQPQVMRLLRGDTPIDLRHDQQLIKYINKVASAKQLTVSQVLRTSWSEIAPSEEELLKWPVFVELGCVEQPDKNEDSVSFGTNRTKTTSWDVVSGRFKVLQELNRAVNQILTFVPFAVSGLDSRHEQRHINQLDLHSASRPLHLRNIITNQKHRMISTIKRSVWEDALERTAEPGLAYELAIDRPKAMRHRLSGRIDTDGRYTVFAQAFRQLTALGGSQFRRKSAVFSVSFLGENAQDAGGPYRETLAQFTEELHSTQLPLLIASSNTQHNVGAAREKWVLNPSSTSGTSLQMFEFLGKMMGAAMRSQEYMPLQIALLIWKKLTGEPVTSDDLTLVDSMIVNSMKKIRTIDQCGVTADMFEDIVMETFTTLSTDNRTMALKPNGANVPVTFDSRIAFADLVEAYRLSEFDVQIEAILRGLATVVPVHLLSLFTGAEMELMVCGSPEVDVDLLQRCTEYSSCRATDDHIVWFWQVLREFSCEERNAFLRFVWGRSRLPAVEKEFPQRFKLQSFNKMVSGSVDKFLPISHTCFFSVEMPRYSSAQVLRERLLYAMYNCQEIDGDGDTIAANQLNWEE